MNNKELLQIQHQKDTVHYMIRGHGAMTGKIADINKVNPLNNTIVTTYTKVGKDLIASTPETDIAVCSLSDKDYDGKYYSSKFTSITNSNSYRRLSF